MNPNRPDKLTDLTRWNRAGLDRFQYVDGDAATWLEELRLAMMGLTAHGAEFEERLPETWRYRFSDEAEWPDPADRTAFMEKLVWKALARGYPDRAETARKRNARLIEQYADAPGEYGWEVMRAAARAAHVLLGHQNAYANEGYIRTATQWENLRRLAEMVNHQPAPPSSAVATVGLILNKDEMPDDEPVEIARGLAMKHTPPEGGSPVVFETLATFKCHPGLNAARARRWNKDIAPLDPDDDVWVLDDKSEAAPGALAVLAHGPEEKTSKKTLDPVGIADLEAMEEGSTIALTDAPAGVLRGEAELWTDPKAVTRGAPRTNSEYVVVKIDTAANYTVNSVVRIKIGDGGWRHRAVLDNRNGHLKIGFSGNLAEDGDPVEIEMLIPVGKDGGQYTGPLAFGDDGYYVDFNGDVIKAGSADLEEEGEDGEDVHVGYTYTINDTNEEPARGGVFVRTEAVKVEKATIVKKPPPAIPGPDKPHHVIRFTGKPPKQLGIGDLYVMRSVDDDAREALRVAGLAVEADSYVIQFDENVTDSALEFEPDRQEFHGPMLRVARPLHFDRSQELALAGTKLRFTGLTAGAKSQLRVGRLCLIEDERPGGAAPVRATITQVKEEGLADNKIDVWFEAVDGLDAFIAGWTTFNLNAVLASHGATKSPKTLGSGDGEKARQTFRFSAREVSFIPSTLAETGVAPDMDVSVDGRLWTYRDLIDPTAEGVDAFSTSMTEDGALTIHFRRRLPTGSNNLVVRRYRTGVGPKGSVPAGAFVKPMKKHRFVTAIRQPFPSAGGAKREPVEDIRVNAPARLAANGRAVSVKDFERLCVRRSDIRQAHARAVANPARPEDVEIIVVPAGTGELNDALKEEITTFIKARAVPGVKVAISPYEAIGLTMHANVFTDTSEFDKTDMQEACIAALVSAFSLETRRLGQTVYISEIAAVLERVEGVHAVTVKSIGLDPVNAPILRTAETDGEPSAFIPFVHQLISVDPDDPAAVAVTVKDLP